MECTFFEKIKVKLSDNFDEMTEEEKIEYYNNTFLDYAYIDRKDKSVLCVLNQKKELEKSNVESRTIEYLSLYRRMIPGYQEGEVLIRREKNFNMGIVSYKSNALTRDLFNVFSVMNFEEKEILIQMSCDLKVAFNKLPVFTNMLQSLYIEDN